MFFFNRHSRWLARAVQLATAAESQKTQASCEGTGGVPCSCIVVSPSDAALAETVSPVCASSRLDHAVFLATAAVGRLRLEEKSAEDETEGYICTNCDVYLSSEPCMMCAMALLHSRVRRVFFARYLQEAGALASRWCLHLNKKLNHSFLVFAPSKSKASLV